MDINKQPEGEKPIARTAPATDAPAGAALAAATRPSGRDAAQRHIATDHLVRNLKGHTISSGFITITSQGIKFAVTLVSTMVLARLLMPRDFGLVAMVTTVTGLLQVFKSAGLSAATIQREDITHAQVSTLFWINSALGVVLAIFAAAAAPAIAWFYREPRLVPITLALSISFLLNGTTVQHQALLTRQMRFKATAAIEISSVVLGYSTGIIMALLGYRYWSLVGLSLSQQTCNVLFTWAISGWRPQLPRRCTGVGPLLGFGANLTGGNIVRYLTRSLDNLLIGRIYGAADVGLYSRAVALLRRPMHHYLVPINAVLLPALSRLQGDPARYRRVFLQLYEVMAVVGFGTAGLFLALSHPVTLVILGPKWEQAAPIFAAFTLTALYSPLTATTSWLFITQGRGRDKLVSDALASGVTVVSIAVGLPYGAFGVALAISIGGLLVRLPVAYYLAGRRGPVAASDLWALFFRHLPLALAAFAGAYLPLELLLAHHRSVVQLAIAGVGGLAAVTGLAMARTVHRKVVLRIAEIALDYLRRQNTKDFGKTRASVPGGDAKC